jgi:hypothetical protein
MADKLAQVVTDLRTQCSEYLGTSKGSGLVAIEVVPGIRIGEVNGIKASVQRVAVATAEKVSGATYFPDQFKIELVSFLPYSQYGTPKGDDMRSLIRKVETLFNVRRRRYFPPTDDSYERAILEIFAPSIEHR